MDSDFIASETPFDPDQGIWFKYARIYQDREKEIREFEDHLKVRLPKDFVNMIGENCEGEFDGWYEVRKDSEGSLVWMHLLLMKLPDSVDEELDQMPGHEGRSNITTKVLEAEPRLFFREGQLAYLPFGTACQFHPDGSGIHGYLAFEVEDDYRIVFIQDSSS